MLEYCPLDRLAVPDEGGFRTGSYLIFILFANAVDPFYPLNPNNFHAERNTQ
jgi:hypothetical protein